MKHILYFLILLLFVYAPKADASLNSYRVQNNLKETGSRDFLCRLADERLRQVAISWTHADLYQTLKKYPMGLYYENIARGFSSQRAVLKAWQASPTHNSVLLSRMEYACIRHYKDYYILEGYL